MEYVKPAVINPATVNSAKCGDGPCGRPCSVNRDYNKAIKSIRGCRAIVLCPLFISMKRLEISI